jgi:hypothetical protein
MECPNTRAGPNSNTNESSGKPAETYKNLWTRKLYILQEFRLTKGGLHQGGGLHAQDMSGMVTQKISSQSSQNQTSTRTWKEIKANSKWSANNRKMQCPLAIITKKEGMSITKKNGQKLDEETNVVGPDPHESALFWLSWTLEQENLPKLTNIPVSDFLPDLYVLLYSIFARTIQLFETVKSEKDPDPHWFGSLGPDPDPHWFGSLDPDPDPQRGKK